MASDADLTHEFFQVRRHGDLAVIVPSAQVEHLPETLLEPAAKMVLAPLHQDPPNHIIVDLSGVTYFGSAFITFLLRCHEVVKPRGSELVLAGVKPKSKVQELIRTTALDTLWAIYETLPEARANLGESD